MPATTLTKLVAEAAALTCCVAFGCGAPGGPSDVLPLAEAMRGVAAEAQANATLPPPPATSAPGPTTITISAIGDCAIGDLHYGAGAPGSFLAKLEQVESPLDYPFSGVAQLFAEDDLTIANLEGTFTEREAWHNPVFSIRGKPSYAQMLRRGGVELVDVDNNHSHDYGPGGHDDTKRALDAAGVAYFGRKIVDRREIKGMKVVNLGYLGGPAGTQGRVEADVAREKGPGTIVIVSFHWGVEGFYATHPDQQSLGRATIDAGADLVLGHHPHVLQGIETYKGRHIVYSLGNFVFGANSQPKDTDSLIYQERFIVDDGEVTAREQTLIPVRISSTPSQNDFRPVVVEGDDARRILAKVAKLSAAL